MKSNKSFHGKGRAWVPPTITKLAIGDRNQVACSRPEDREPRLRLSERRAAASRDARREIRLCIGMVVSPIHPDRLDCGHKKDPASLAGYNTGRRQAVAKAFHIR